MTPIFLLSIFVSLICIESKLILISFDGFRHDYVDSHNLLFIKKYFLNKGVRVKNGLINAFTTVTFPNHMTLATGLYAETHGIVANAMFDPVINETFYAFGSKDNDTKWFAQNEITMPIWILNQIYAGKSAVVGGFPGANVPFANQTLFYSEDYNNKLDWYEKVNRIVDLFADQRINFGVLYFPEPDETGHQFGPYSDEIRAVLEKIDLLIGYLMIRLEDLGLLHTVNVIITSDHGMDTASYKKSIDLSDYVDVNLFNMYGGLTQINIFPKNMSHLDFIYNSLKNIPHYNVFKHDQVPDRFNYKRNERIGPIVMFGDVGYETFRQNRSNFNWKYWKGDHGGDNQVLSMHPVFLARGPVFKKKFTQEKKVFSVDVYPLMCYILGLKPGIVNGTLDNFEDMLDNFNKEKSFFFMNNLFNMAFFVIFIFLMAIFVQLKLFFVNRSYRHQKILTSSISSVRLI